MDRSDEIRIDILRSRERGWAARLRYAASLLDQGPALAIIEDVCRELDPPASKSDVQRALEGATCETQLVNAIQVPKTEPRPRTSDYGGQRGSEAGCYG